MQTKPFVSPLESATHAFPQTCHAATAAQHKAILLHKDPSASDVAKWKFCHTNSRGAGKEPFGEVLAKFQLWKS
jgi:hypothetical protein